MPDDYKIFLQLDARVDELTERLATVEGKLVDPPRSVTKLISEYGGLVALLLSIFLASYTAYDAVFIEPQNALISQRENLRNRINDLVEIRARLAAVDFTNPNASAQIGVWSATRIALIDEIEIAERAATMVSVFKFADRVLLAEENESFERFPQALRHAELALYSAANPLEKGIALSTQARLYGRSTNLKAMRATYRLSVDSQKSVTIGGNNILHPVSSYVMWLHFELRNGACKDAQAVYAELKKVLAEADAPQSARDEAQALLIRMLRETSHKCEFKG